MDFLFLMRLRSDDAIFYLPDALLILLRAVNQFSEFSKNRVTTRTWRVVRKGSLRPRPRYIIHVSIAIIYARGHSADRVNLASDKDWISAKKEVSPYRRYFFFQIATKGIP